MADKRFKICQGFHTNPETQEETQCPIKEYCKRFKGNYDTQEELLKLLRYKRKPNQINVYMPNYKPHLAGCRHFINNSNKYIKFYEKRLRHK